MISHQYAGIPLHLSMQIQNKTIKAMTRHQNNLVIAIEPFIVYSFPLEFRNNTIIQAGKRKEIVREVKDIYISELCSIDNILLVFVQGKSSKGQLFTLPEDGKLNKIIDNVNCFAINQYSNEKYILVGYNHKLSLYKFASEKSCKICSGWPIELESKILSVSMSYPYSIILTAEKMYSINLSDQSRNVNRSPCNPSPYTMALSHEFFLTYYAHSSMKIDSNLSTNISPISFDEEAIDHSYNGSLIATMVKNSIHIYNFEGYRAKAYVSNPFRITQFNNYFIYSTKSGIYYLSEVTNLMDDIISGFVSENANFDTDKLLSIFEQLWLSNKKDYALSLIKFEKTQEEMIPKILQIFDFFVLPFEGKPFMIIDDYDKKEIHKLLYYELDSLNLFQPDQIEFINTAKFELLAEMNDLKALSAFIEKNTNLKINKEMIDKFYQKARSKSNNAILSSYPFFLLYLGKIDEALNEFLKTKDYKEYSNILIQKASDFNFVEQKLDVLIKNAPQKAIDVLSCDQISSQKSIDLVKKKYPMYLTPVLRKLIDHKGIVDREEISNFYISQMINLITIINESEKNPAKFDKSQFQFTNTVVNNPNASPSDIKKELNEMLCDFIIKYRSIIDSSILVKNISIVSSFNLKFEIYKTSKDYEKVFILLSEKESDFKKCEEFVGGEKDPQILQLFLTFAKNNFDSKKNLKNKGFSCYLFEIIAKFIEFIDVESAMNLIDGEKISIDDGFLSEIEQAYSAVDTRRMNTETKAAFAESEEFESIYERTTLESKLVTVNAEMTCSHCGNPLGYRFIQMTPDGQFYHNKCIKQMKRKSNL